MNNIRRNELEEIYNDLREICDRLENVKCDEEEYYNNIPENLKYSERGEKAEEAVSALEDALGEIEEALDNIEMAKE